MTSSSGARSPRRCYAEATFCVALAQLERPGSPAIALAIFLSSMSLRSGAPTFGTPEPALAYFAIGSTPRRLEEYRCVAAATSCASKVADSQAASESANSIWPAFLGGANFMLPCGRLRPERGTCGDAPH